MKTSDGTTKFPWKLPNAWVITEEQKRGLIVWCKEKNIHYAKTQWKKVYGKGAPSLFAIRKLLKNYEKYGEECFEETFSAKSINTKQKDVELIDNVRKAYEDNPSLGLTEAAIMFKISTTKLNKIIMENGIKIIRIRKFNKKKSYKPIAVDPKLRYELVKNICKAYEENPLLGIDEGAERFNISRTTILKIANECGIKIIKKKPFQGRKIERKQKETKTKRQNIKLPKNIITKNQNTSLKNKLTTCTTPSVNKIIKSEKNPIMVPTIIVPGNIIHTIVPENWVQESFNKLFPTTITTTNTANDNNNEEGTTTCMDITPEFISSDLDMFDTDIEPTDINLDESKKPTKYRLYHPKANFTRLKNILKKNNLKKQMNSASGVVGASEDLDRDSDSGSEDVDRDSGSEDDMDQYISNTNGVITFEENDVQVMDHDDDEGQSINDNKIRNLKVPVRRQRSKGQRSKNKTRKSLQNEELLDL